MRKILLAFAVALLIIPTYPTFAAVSNWQRSSFLVPRNANDFATEGAKETMRRMKALGFNYVTFSIPYYQDTNTTSDIHAGPDTPADQSLISGIQYAHSIGLQVQLTTYVYTKEHPWRAMIDPVDKPLWFKNFTQIILHYASIAQQQGVEQFSLGGEYIRLSSQEIDPNNTQYWLDVIAKVRAAYSGKLTYNGQWEWDWHWADEKEQIGFWPALDVISINEYIDLYSDPNDVEALKAEWGNHAPSLLNLARKYQKPTVIGETGWRNIEGGLVDPWRWYEGIPANEQLQANAYEAFLSFWNNHPEMQGVHFWYWEPNPATGGPGVTDFTTQNKLAEHVIAKHFGGSVPTLTPDSSLPLRINAGYGGVNEFQTDRNFYGGLVATTEQPIQGLTSPNIYQSERYGQSTYTFNVPNGNYELKLHFAEFYFTNPGQRVFNVNVNNAAVISNLDIVQEAGGALKPLVRTIPVTVNNGQLKIDFLSVVENPKVSAIEIIAINPPPPPAPQVPETTTFDASTSSGLQATPGSPINIPVSIKPIGGKATDKIIDIEIYNSQNQKVHQQFFEHENFGQDEQRTFTAHWTPPAAGSYAIKLGVFASGWSSNHYWNNSLGQITVSSPNNPPPQPNPTPVSCDVIGSNAFTACYYNNIDFTELKLASSISSINFDWGGGSPSNVIDADTFSARYQGTFAFEAGEYEFTVTGDDGVRLFIDNVLVLDKWIDQPPTTYTVNPSLSDGAHTIKLEYFERYGGAMAKLSWNKKAPSTNSPKIDFWWPTDGSNVSGTVLFKARVSNLDPSQYSMYWQVDGDRLNDTFTSGSEKQAYVDVSGWTWRASGPYTITFLAKRPDGSIIDQKSVNITTSP